METHQTTNLGIAGSIPAKLVFFLFYIHGPSGHGLLFFCFPHTIEKKSAPSRARTYDPGVISTMLYRLSYESSAETHTLPLHALTYTLTDAKSED